MSSPQPPPPTKPAFDELIELHYSLWQKLWMTALWAYFAGAIIYWAVIGLASGPSVIAIAGVGGCWSSARCC